MERPLSCPTQVTEVNVQEPILARAATDAADRLVHADEPLASLQRSCGGELPGTVAVPELLELVRKARRYRLRLARSISAQDGAETVTAWVEVDPRGEDEADGCDIVLRSWQSTPLAPDETRGVMERRAAMDREVSELSARLDAEQRILFVASDSPELRALADAMSAGVGRPFTDFLAPESHGARALHWRLLDGAPVQVAGSPRAWRIVLLPQSRPGHDPVGFELLLVSDEPPPQVEPEGEGVFVSGGQGLVGHDLAPVLRQPIARIVANAETIRSRLAGPLPDAYANYAAEIANAGRLLLGLVEDLGDLEVVESEGFVTAPDHIDLGEVARQATGILGVRAREKGIVVAAAGDTVRAVAEFRRVLQILINLIGNAIRYSPENSRIEVRVEQAGEQARVLVVDQGPGLSDADQAIVFEKFERLGRSGDGGSGLGLYISRRLARAMGGDLRVESQPGQGARFILEVPADGTADPQ
ncbi:sensor histidine kinase KdpD [Novosphingobium sp. 9U]|uniref:sensor histidine kinase n=1 Tax=Novosphingobium sp. 9U TaxID=2653158 RepID=UPI0012F4008A|nr:HAMP domain-containing sensor histidine kinase [Novosphingobium sp. 9U]VWX52036.1 Histidine kinase [Novosphingobium sp. 9U]